MGIYGCEVHPPTMTNSADDVVGYPTDAAVKLAYALLSGRTTPKVTKAVAIDGWMYLTVNQDVEIVFRAGAYSRLKNASDEQLNKVTLEIKGKALHWEEFDEDIRVEDIVLGYKPL